MQELSQYIRNHLEKPVVLIGLMGAGKTKIGGILAKSLGLPFVDADHEIEAAAECTILEIFDRHGEPAFRDLERRVISRLLSDELKVLAPGGGAIMDDETATLIWGKSLSVWLKADLDVLVERTSHNANRPLLKNGNPREILTGLMEKRNPVYAKASLTVETNAAEAEENARMVLTAIHDHLINQEEKV